MLARILLMFEFPKRQTSLEARKLEHALSSRNNIPEEITARIDSISGGELTGEFRISPHICGGASEAMLNIIGEALAKTNLFNSVLLGMFLPSKPSVELMELT